MPIGGIGCGQLYLGGDGRLWWWDIYNAQMPEECFYEPGQAYVHPPTPDDSGNPATQVIQGFALRIGDDLRTLDRRGFRDIAFAGRYPVGTVTYRDAACPVAVELTACSPFIPLEVQDSTFPGTYLRYRLTNTGSAPVQATFAGWLENANAQATRHLTSGALSNRLETIAGQPALVCTATPNTSHRLQRDLGSQCLLFTGDGPLTVSGRTACDELPAGAFAAAQPTTAEMPFAVAARGHLVGALTATVTLAPGESRTITAILAWHNPTKLPLDIRTDRRRANATRFKDVVEVATTLAARRDELLSATIAWRDTWYDSTLPWWFLDRTMANTSTLATGTCVALAGGRFYGNEGVNSCQGTCTHVYGYGQAIGRLFPAIERDLRERVDLGLGYDPATGRVLTRGEFQDPWAVDGHTMAILRCWREHQMSPDGNFLAATWPRIKKAFLPLFDLDPQQEGLLQGPQHNTLDAIWYGKNAWISGLYVAALRAGAALAREANDAPFADRCQTLADRGTANLSAQLFEGGWFINRVDPAHPDTTNSGTGCHIDQMLGQSWAFQVDLPRVFKTEDARTALDALWRNNFTTDVGPWRAANKPGRVYATADEGGLVMCTFPRPDWDFVKASGQGKGAWASYLNECMTGFEYQVASQMLWEGKVTEGLAITRAIHDRYDGAKRNPWNEVECGNHYARAMASYGVFIAACGFTCHGPRGELGFAPRIHPEDFRAAFTAPEGWGTYAQRRTATGLEASLTVRHGQVSLQALRLMPDPAHRPTSATATLAGQPVAVDLEPAADGAVRVVLRQRTVLPTAGVLAVSLL